MRLSSTFAASALGMTLATTAGFHAPLPKGATAGVSASATAETPRKPPPNSAGAHFEKPGAVRLDARLGQASLAQNSDGETYMMVTLHGGEQTSTTPPPLRLGIVIDRSGSMRGARMANAITAASSAIERLREVDTLTVVSFDTQSQVVVPPTRVTDSVKPALLAAVRGIPVGGDTCISCGIEEAMHQLASTDDGTPTDQVRRMLLLSDGATNHGVRDVPGLRSIAGRSRDEGCAISTVGLDVDFDEKVMGALASESNGKHYFVRNAPDLSTIFGEELDALTATVAGGAEVTVDLAPGVALDEVMDRSFTRVGVSRVRIPFGSIAAHEDRTLLLKLRVPTNDLGAASIAKVNLHYRDLGAATDASVDGSLALDVSTATADMDPVVNARVERSRTAQTLTDANDLLSKGRPDAAKKLIDAQTVALGPQRAMALSKAFGGAGSGFAKDDFDGQLSALADARHAAEPIAPTPGRFASSSGGSTLQGNARPLATAAPAPAAPSDPSVKAQIRQNQQKVNAMRF